MPRGNASPSRARSLLEPTGLASATSRRLPLDDEPTYSVSEINARVRDVLRERFPRPVWVRGEIKGYDLRKHRPWVSFKLVEKDATSEDLLAEADVILSPEDRRTVEAILQRAENAFQLQDGIEVRFRVEVDMWVKAGRYQLRVRSVDPTYTLGRLAQNRQRLLEALAQRGLLERNKQVALVMVPLRVGVIAASGSAGFADFVTHLAQSGLAFAVTHVDAAMQGPQVEADVCRAIRALNRGSLVDVIVITRGGGSATDLSWFDRLGLAEAIATSGVPILTGLGHTHDVSVIDAVAHANLKTPTDAAQFLIDRVHAFLRALGEASQGLEQRAGDLLDAQRVLIKDLGQGLSEAVQSVVSHVQIWLVDRQRDLVANSEGIVSVQREAVRGWRQRISPARVQQLLEHRQDWTNEIGSRLHARTLPLFPRLQDELLQRRRFYTFPRVSRPLLRERLHLQAAADRASALDPIKTLRRGFSIARTAEGAIVSRVSQVKPDERLTTQVSDGFIHARVQAVEPQRREGAGG